MLVRLGASVPSLLRRALRARPVFFCGALNAPPPWLDREIRGIPIAGGPNFFESVATARQRSNWRRRRGKSLVSQQARLPVLRALFRQLSGPCRLQPLGLVEVLDLAGPDETDRSRRSGPCGVHSNASGDRVLSDGLACGAEYGTD